MLKEDNVSLTCLTSHLEYQHAPMSKTFTLENHIKPVFVQTYKHIVSLPKFMRDTNVGDGSCHVHVCAVEGTVYGFGLLQVVLVRNY